MTHMPKTIPEGWKNFVTRIMALYAHGFVEDDSRREDYDFLAIHYHWYNRYAEDVSEFSFFFQLPMP